MILKCLTHRSACNKVIVNATDKSNIMVEVLIISTI